MHKYIPAKSFDHSRTRAASGGPWRPAPPCALKPVPIADTYKRSKPSGCYVGFFASVSRYGRRLIFLGLFGAPILTLSTTSLRGPVFLLIAQQGQACMGARTPPSQQTRQPNGGFHLRLPVPLRGAMQRTVIVMNFDFVICSSGQIGLGLH